MEPVDLVGEGFVMRFFEGNSGKLSMMRLLCFLAVVGLVPVFYLQPEQSGSAATVLAIALAGKWLQRRSE